MTRLLAIDIGNSAVSCGIYEEGARLATHRFATAEKNPAPDLVSFLGECRPTLCAIASVVPAATERWRTMLVDEIGLKPRLLDALSIPDLEVGLAEPEAVGIDRLVNAWEARRRFGVPIVVVDMGTATTFDVVDRDGVYRGGAIAPGIRLSFESLAQKTALLPPVQDAPLERIIGRNTVEAIRSGVILGHVEMVRGLARRMAEELGGAAVIATGGAAKLVAPHIDGLFQEILPHLTLDGIAGIAGLRR
jgi:type III pantothenate kinase